MSRFFFDCFDGETHLVDEYGMDLDAEADVRDHAAVLAQSLLTDGFPVVDARLVTVSVRPSDGPAIYLAQCSFIGRWTKARDGKMPAPDAG